MAVLRGLRAALRDSPLRGPTLRVLSLVRRIASAPGGIYTLAYHHIRAQHRANFVRQLEYLGRYATFIGADRAIELLRSGMATAERHVLVSFDDGYADLVDAALPVLADRGIPAIAFVVSAWLDRRPEDGTMSRADLERWCRHGMEVGSHSESHRLLIGLSDQEASEELVRSAVALAQATGKTPRHFACPWGVPGRDFGPERMARLAGAAGYASLFTTMRGVATGPSDIWLMPRHVVEPEWPLHELNALMGTSPLSSNSHRAQRNWDEA